MHDVAPHRPGPPPAAASPAGPPATLRQHLLRTALIVLVLGVLPHGLAADATWRVLGTLVAVAMVVRSLQLVWRAAFSTAPRHLGGY